MKAEIFCNHLEYYSFANNLRKFRLHGNTVDLKCKFSSNVIIVRSKGTEMKDQFMQIDSCQLLLKFGFVISQSTQCCVLINVLEIFNSKEH